MGKSSEEGTKNKGGRPIAINEEQLQIFKDTVDKYPFSTDSELFFMFDLECEEREIKPLSYTTFKEYKSNPDGYKTNPNYDLIRRFSAVIKKAQVLQKNELVGDIKKGESGWQAKAWIAERKFSDNWAATTKAKQESVNYNVETTKEEYKEINKALEEDY